ncbi:Cell Wall Hydrolase [Rhodobacteraceae bacterium THAF1]|uniref:cell wall hydrolase n=1 Tax=Palleronia sp. THAF1 TaxID=2587842 RepID=UPI000F3C149C|nr:cell wall hydrolase [Palleronia sp. THAF1]QFU07515.1 Spore cortex-lytic enzyme precursor [Palleronia sp. THAF1]VDC20478.1 Cell Wall Hydrolase [Rhodobacteraceae bacterium THAF1]
MRSDLFALRRLARLMLVCLFVSATALPATAEIRFSTKGSIDIGIETTPPSLDDRLMGMLGADAPVLKPARSATLATALGLTRSRPTMDIEYSKAFLDALPAASGDAQWKCLTEALYFEARGETVQGIFAVAEVILNRAESSRFPDSVCRVIGQGVGNGRGCQFSYKCDRHPEVFRERAAHLRMGKIAKLVLDETAPLDLTDGALFYHTKAVSPSWSRVFARTTTIGAHHFYNYG